MGAAENKQRMRGVFDEMARGNTAPFVDAMAEDIRWTIIGDGVWSGSWNGIASVQIELFHPLFAQFATRYRAEAVRMIAEDDFVVIESRGDVTTKAGRPYRNSYCYVCRLQGGKIRELTEYCDTQLIAEALEPPAARLAA